MKTKKLLSLAFLALFAGVIFQGCSKDDELVKNENETQWSVRPDFATLDNRPADEIAKSMVTDKDATPVVNAGTLHA